MTLTCRGGSAFHAHKVILAAASTYFKSFFKEVWGKIYQHPVIFVKDVESSELEYLLQFIYRGEVDIPSEEIERLIEIAKDLGIIGLDAVNTDNGEKKSERRTLKGTKRKATASPAASTSKQPKVKKEHDNPLGDEDFGDFIDDEQGALDDDDDGDDTKVDPNFDSGPSSSPNLTEPRVASTYLSKTRKAVVKADNVETKETVAVNIKKEKVALPIKWLKGKRRYTKKKQQEYVEKENVSVPIQEVLSTERDAPMLVVNGFTYHNHMAGSVKVLWRCTIKGCKGTVATYRDYELSMVAAQRRDHFHLPDPLALERARFTKKLKDKWAEVSQDCDLGNKAKTMEMNNYAKSLLKSIPEELNECLPDEKFVLRMLQRWKQKKREKDGIPKPEVTSERVTNSANNQALTLPMRKYEKKEKKKKVQCIRKIIWKTCSFYRRWLNLC